MELRFMEGNSSSQKHQLESVRSILSCVCRYSSQTFKSVKPLTPKADMGRSCSDINGT